MAPTSIRVDPDMPGPWWLFLGGIYTGLNLAADFGRYALRSHGTELLGNAAMAAMGVAVAVWSAAIALAKRRQGPPPPP